MRRSSCWGKPGHRPWNGQASGQQRRHHIQPVIRRHLAGLLHRHDARPSTSALWFARRAPFRSAFFFDHGLRRLKPLKRCKAIIPRNFNLGQPVRHLRRLTRSCLLKGVRKPMCHIERNNKGPMFVGIPKLMLTMTMPISPPDELASSVLATINQDASVLTSRNLGDECVQRVKGARHSQRIPLTPTMLDFTIAKIPARTGSGRPGQAFTTLRRPASSALLSLDLPGLWLGVAQAPS